jgi:glycolate oxidase
MMLAPAFRAELERIVGPDHVIDDPATLQRYGTDAMNRGTAADAVALPGSTDEVSRIARACYGAKVPFVPRGGGTGYTGGAVPLRGGVVISLERLNRILDIDEENLLAVVEPHVVTGDLQAAVERVGLFYPPDPASLQQSVIGGNVAECAGGPRAFKYGTTKRYVLGLEAVLPTGEVIETGSKAVKNVVGYDLTQLLVGSEGTLAIVTKIVLRLIPRPPEVATLRATFADIDAAVAAVTELLRARVIPATLEIIDAECLESVARYAGAQMAPEGTGAVLLVEVDGLEQAVSEEIVRVDAAVRRAGAREVLRASNEAERQELWRVRRELSPSLKLIAPVKFNHDVVVPRGRVPRLFGLVERLRRDYRLKIPCFGHAGDGNIHVNIMVDPGEAGAMERAQEAQVALFRGVVALEGSISGEHGIGFAKAPYLSLELSPVEIDLMKRIKRVFDPENLLNPGKIFPLESS